MSLSRERLPEMVYPIPPMIDLEAAYTRLVEGDRAAIKIVTAQTSNQRRLIAELLQEAAGPLLHEDGVPYRKINTELGQEEGGLLPRGFTVRVIRIEEESDLTAEVVDQIRISRSRLQAVFIVTRPGFGHDPNGPLGNLVTPETLVRVTQ